MRCVPRPAAATTHSLCCRRQTPTSTSGCGATPPAAHQAVVRSSAAPTRPTHPRAPLLTTSGKARMRPTRGAMSWEQSVSAPCAMIAPPLCTQTAIARTQARSSTPSAWAPSRTRALPLSANRTPPVRLRIGTLTPTPENDPLQVRAGRRCRGVVVPRGRHRRHGHIQGHRAERAW